MGVVNPGNPCPVFPQGAPVTSNGFSHPFDPAYRAPSAHGSMTTNRSLDHGEPLHRSFYKKTNEIERILPEFNGRNISVTHFIREYRDNSPLWIVPKKSESKGIKRWRLVTDFRALNEKTIASAYPLPNITEILDQLGCCKYFTTLDLASGFHQVPIDPSDAPKTAFSTPFRHLQCKRMPMVLKGAPSTFQALMDRVLSGLQGIELLIYMDDIVVYAKPLEEYTEKMKKLMGRLNTACFTLQPDKCLFLRKEVAYLGHIISEAGVKPDPSKTKVVADFSRPKNQKNIKQLLGLTGNYPRFIHEFAKIARPFTELLKKDASYVWGTRKEEAFNKF